MSLSLVASTTASKVNSSVAAETLSSARLFDPSQNICPAYGGVDTAGRPAVADSQITKFAGCNSALDRILVENMLNRNVVSDHTYLNMGGLSGVMWTDPSISKMRVVDRDAQMQTRADMLGNAGTAGPLGAVPGSVNTTYFGSIGGIAKAANNIGGAGEMFMRNGQQRFTAAQPAPAAKYEKYSIGGYGQAERLRKVNISERVNTVQRRLG